MSIGKINTNGDKGSNFNCQKRMLQILAECCLGNTVARSYTNEERDAGTFGIGTIIYNTEISRFQGWDGSSWIDL